MTHGPASSCIWRSRGFKIPTLHYTPRIAGRSSKSEGSWCLTTGVSSPAPQQKKAAPSSGRPHDRIYRFSERADVGIDFLLSVFLLVAVALLELADELAF